MNNLNKNNTTPDVEDPMGSEDAKPSTGIYVLEEGETLNKEFANAETITFTWEKAADGVQTRRFPEQGRKCCSLERWKQLLCIHTESRTGHLHERCIKQDVLKLYSTDNDQI